MAAARGGLRRRRALPYGRGRLLLCEPIRSPPAACRRLCLRQRRPRPGVAQLAHRRRLFRGPAAGRRALSVPGGETPRRDGQLAVLRRPRIRGRRLTPAALVDTYRYRRVVKGCGYNDMRECRSCGSSATAPADVIIVPLD